MNIIHLLTENTINQIAAGEVIQRPSSVVKELMENSIDAKSKNIKVYIKDGGKTLIHVIDDGNGMNKTDAQTSFKRHATSKIKNAKDLFKIKTMGFRGEAMSSIASISHVEMQTKLNTEELGTKIFVEGGEIKSIKKCNCQKGTSIKIKNLFYNVPARRKFLKTEKIEIKHITNEFIKIALSNINVNCSLFINNQEYYHLEKSNLRKRIVNILGKKSNDKLVPIEEETNLVNITGFIGKPEFAKRTRGEQYFFINNRFIKSNYLNHAVSKAFEELISEGYHPSYFIKLIIDPNLIDVNIHPTKNEVKFEDEKSIYQILRSTIKKSLGSYNIAPTLDFNTESSFEIPLGEKVLHPSEPKIKVNTNYNPFKKKEEVNYFKLEEMINSTYESIQRELNISSKSNTNYPAFQIENGIIITKNKDSIIIINQQYAHERILFERFKKKTHIANSQKLIFPKKILFNNLEIKRLKDISTELTSVGFLIEFLEEAIQVIAIPVEYQQENLEEKFSEILSNNEIEEESINKKLDKEKRISLSKVLSIKNSKKLTNNEIKLLIQELFKCKMPSVSPRGKKTYFNISTDDIKIQFK